MAVRRKRTKPSVLPPQAPVEAMPDIETLAIDDGAPVDGIYSEKQMRLLTEPLYSSWAGPGQKRTFMALANVGLFYQVEEPPLVPDVMLSVDVKVKKLSEKRNNTYFLWQYGKAPEVIVEIVSNKEGNELGDKLIMYARIGVPYYVVWDPMNFLKMGRLQSFVIRGKQYEKNGLWFDEANLGMAEWEGVYEGSHNPWIRWTDERGRLIPTGAELSLQSQKRAKTAVKRAKVSELQAKQTAARASKAEQEAKKSAERATKAEQEVERLQARLRTLEIKPDDA